MHTDRNEIKETNSSVPLTMSLNNKDNVFIIMVFSFVFIMMISFLIASNLLTSNATKKGLLDGWKEIVYNTADNMNNSKIFAGLMIILMNITSKYVPIKLGKTMERLMKHYISAPLLVFTVSWIGTRDLYIEFIITGLYILFAEMLFNEDSHFCILSEEFRDYHDKMEKEEQDKNDRLTDEDVIKAKTILEKAKRQNMAIMEYEGYTMK